MKNNKAARRLIKVLYALVITCMIGKWGFYMAYMQRGYRAVGGEYILIITTYLAAWKAVSNLLNALEELKHERNCKKRRGRSASWLRDNR